MNLADPVQLIHAKISYLGANLSFALGVNGPYHGVNFLENPHGQRRFSMERPLFARPAVER